METAAERLRKEIKRAPSVSKKEFIDKVSDDVKRYGYAYFITGYHVETNCKGCMLYINSKDVDLCLSYASEEGFKHSWETNGYGVKCLTFTL